ncbi:MULTISPECIES: hypothetical protein [Cyanophyceae]|nr:MULTISPECIES: hypothetical protein [Cyanophyceae]NQZ64989.1 hypothetical protein [Crocosphaera sp.]
MVDYWAGFSRYVEKSEGVGCSKTFFFSLHPTPYPLPPVFTGVERTSREK